jgi:hypothetical protein
MAAIRIPIQAPGIFSVISNKASRVTDSFVIVNAFMASLPKKVFEHFSEGSIRKTEIYVYLFMTLIIIQKDFITRFPPGKLYSFSIIDSSFFGLSSCYLLNAGGLFSL